MEVMEALLQRQSVKSYLPTPVEPEKLEQVLEAGRLAPSAFNHQYRRFIVVDDPPSSICCGKKPVPSP